MKPNFRFIFVAPVAKLLHERRAVFNMFLAYSVSKVVKMFSSLLNRNHKFEFEMQMWNRTIDICGVFTALSFQLRQGNSQIQLRIEKGWANDQKLIWNVPSNCFFNSNKNEVSVWIIKMRRSSRVQLQGPDRKRENLDIFEILRQFRIIFTWTWPFLGRSLQQFTS